MREIILQLNFNAFVSSGWYKEKFSVKSKITKFCGTRVVRKVKKGESTTKYSIWNSLTDESLARSPLVFLVLLVFALLPIVVVPVAPVVMWPSVVMWPALVLWLALTEVAVQFDAFPARCCVLLDPLVARPLRPGLRPRRRRALRSWFWRGGGRGFAVLSRRVDPFAESVFDRRPRQRDLHRLGSRNILHEHTAAWGLGWGRCVDLVDCGEARAFDQGWGEDGAFRRLRRQHFFSRFYHRSEDKITTHLVIKLSIWTAIRKTQQYLIFYNLYFNKFLFVAFKKIYSLQYVWKAQLKIVDSLQYVWKAEFFKLYKKWKLSFILNFQTSSSIPVNQLYASLYM